MLIRRFFNFMFLDGIQNEKNIMNYLYGKRIREVNEFWQQSLKRMFPEADDASLITVRYVPNYVGCKTDIEIKIGREVKNVSIKSGKMPHVHQEKLSSFLDFLKNEGVSDKTVNFVAFYLYADGTLDGTGTKKYKAIDLQSKFQNRLKEASSELSEHDFARKLLYRSVVKGAKENRKEVDYVYYGDENHGFLLSKEEILDNFPYKKTDHFKTLHGGPLILMKTSKHIVDNEANQKDITYVQIRWPSLVWDFNKLCDKHE